MKTLITLTKSDRKRIKKLNKKHLKEFFMVFDFDNGKAPEPLGELTFFDFYKGGYHPNEDADFLFQIMMISESQDSIILDPMEVMTFNMLIRGNDND